MPRKGYTPELMGFEPLPPVCKARLNPFAHYNLARVCHTGLGQLSKA